MLTRLRILIVSQDVKFFEALKSALNSYPQVNVILQVKMQSDIENNLSPTQSTIILVDTETVLLNQLLFTRITEHSKNTRLIFTAYKEANIGQLASAKIREFFPKPIIINDFNIKRLVNMIMTRLGESTQKSMPDNIARASSTTAGVARKLIAIAASTGGVDALENVIQHLPTTIPPVLLVIHMPQGFTKMFATRLNRNYRVSVAEAKTGDFLQQGQVLIAPAGKHMQLLDNNGKLSVNCFLGEKVHSVIPSADVLFESIANIPRLNAVGVILTGMGADGAMGLKMMRDNGARTIGQDKASSAIYGMPKVAMDIGAVEFQLPLNQIVNKILSLV